MLKLTRSLFTTLLLLMLGLGIMRLGWGLAQALTFPVVAGSIPLLADNTPIAPPPPKSSEIKNSLLVDPVPTRYQPGLDAYLENCASCHIAIPPEVLPTESWREILRRPDNHFGTVIPNFNRLTQLLIWDYVSTFSRVLPPDTPVPLYAEKSRYFRALHPRVPIPADMTAKTCIVCHPNVAQFDFRTLTPEWNDAP